MLLSIALGTLNRIEHLKRMINSVRERVDGIEYEFVIVDSHSDDGTEAYLRQQKDVVVIEQDRWGAVCAFNEAFKHCSGSFVFNANDDCVVHGDLFNEAIAQMRDEQIGQVAFPFGKEELSTTVAYVRLGRPRNYVMYSNFGITRKWLGDKVSWWGNGLYHKYAGDSELSCRIWDEGYRVVSLQGKGWVEHLEVEDELRVDNVDSPKFYEKWKDWQGV